LKNGVQFELNKDATCTPSNVIIPGIDDTFHFAQFHIHLSSEHTIDDQFFSAELPHMVHLNSDNSRAAVIGTMVEPSRVTDNPVFEPYLQAFRVARAAVECESCLSNEIAAANPKSPGSDNDVHPYKLVEGNTFYHYDGGLTTPLCDEIVWWNLADTVMDISVRQFNDLADMILNTHVVKEDDWQCKKITVANKAGSTSRPVQQLNGRKIDRICPSHLSPPGAGSSTPSHPTPPPTQTPTVTPTCVDSPLTMRIDSSRKQTCEEFLTDANKTFQCANSFIRDHCPSTCNGDCATDSQISFRVPGKQGFKDCQWVARFSTASRCAIDGVKETCRKTCADVVNLD
jgi:carbonic anhydrase